MPKYFLGLILIFFFSSCKKEMDDFSSAPLSDYFPLETGKYITYDLDSTVFIQFGQVQTVIHYQVQDRVDAKITDNLGRPAFRILRFIRQNASQEWIPNNTFMAVPTENSIEFIENNLRFVKLQLPVKQDFSWKGNSFINTTSSSNDVKYLDGWDYVYDSIEQPLVINNTTFGNTITVSEIDYQDNNPLSQPSAYAEKTYSVEKYAKGIGLIYREFLHWEYQPPESPTYGYTGYGIKMSIIDHN
jgi:hypothetical protein